MVVKFVASAQHHPAERLEIILGLKTAGRNEPYPPNPIHDELRRRGDGEPVDDDLLGDCDVHPKRAVFSVPDEPSQAYFFAFNQYVRIRFTPGKVDDTIMIGPKPIINEWPALRKAGFSRIDAVVPSSNGGGETYFFSGTQYALVKVVPSTTDDRLINGPKSIATAWPSLRQAGFDTVDAAFLSPHYKNEIYFFSGTKYALIKVIPYTTDDKLIYGPKTIAAGWPSLRKAGFNTVDAVLPIPNGNGMTYFFSGSQYVLVKVIPHTTDDVLINGPKSVATKWPSLCQAGLYW
ncbi:Hemopexin [Phlegmacium glaucopus]|nr:Hemopexin [Phlegmacium glaucopus]